MLTRGTLFGLAFAIGFAAGGQASAQTVGQTTSVKPGAFKNSAGTLIALGPGAPVIADDLVNTDAEGRTNLRFLDLSTLDIGPGSDVKIDRFVFNPNRTTAGATISLVKGVLRYNSRGAPDGAVKFRTPTSTLGIRGTTTAVAYNTITQESWHQITAGVAEVCPTNIPPSSTSPGPTRPIISKDPYPDALPQRRCVTLTPRGNNTAVVDSAGNIRAFNQPITAADQTLALGQQAGIIGPAGTSLIAGTTGLGLVPAIVGGTILAGIVTGILISNND